MMGPLLPPWRIARFDQIDAEVRDLLLRLDLPVVLPPDLELPEDPFVTASGTSCRRPRHRRPGGPVPLGAADPAERSPSGQADAGVADGDDAAGPRPRE